MKNINMYIKKNNIFVILYNDKLAIINDIGICYYNVKQNKKKWKREQENKRLNKLN